MVGGVCAVLHGAPITTFDLDIVHSRGRDNVDRLLAALGALDVFGEIGKGQTYADLMPNAVAMQVGKGLTIQVLELAALIETKQETADEKDTAVLAILRRVLPERSRS